MQLDLLINSIISNNNKQSSALNINKYEILLLPPTINALHSPDMNEIVIVIDKKGISIPKYSSLLIMMKQLNLLILSLS